MGQLRHRSAPRNRPLASSRPRAWRRPSGPPSRCSVNPTNIDVDSRGRVWVTEGLNYRLTRGGNTRFHRIDEADRIKILEDTDGDGKADKVTVFADQIFPVPMGIAVEEHYEQGRQVPAAAASSSATAPTCSCSRTPTATTRPTSAIRS